MDSKFGKDVGLAIRVLCRELRAMGFICKIALLIVYINLVLCIDLQARNDIKFDHATKIDSACTSTIIQDRDGFIWIGSLTGLIKYNGYELKYYTSGNSTISGAYITSILEDRDGLLWIATSANGLNSYNKETDTFTHYKHKPQTVNSITGNVFNYSPHTVIEDKSGILWIGTRNGLSKYDKSKNLFTRYTHDPNNPNSLSDNDIWVITEDKNGFFWIGTREGGLNRLDPKTGNFTNYRHAAGNSKSLSDNWVYSILIDRDGILWVGTKSGGLNKFDKHTETFTHYIHDPDDPTSLSTNEIYSIYETRAGEIWIHAYIDSAGLNKFNKKNGTVTRYRYDPDDPDSLRSDSVFAVCEDRSGIFWVLYNTEGLGKYDKENRKFTYYRHNPNNDNTIGAPCIVPIYEGSKGDIWFGTVNGGLSRYHRTLNEFKTFTNTPDDADTIRNDYPTGIYEDSEGTFWISTWQNTLSIFDREKEKVVRHYDFNAVKAAMVIMEDRKNPDILWLGCQGYGLVRFNKKSETFKQYKNSPNDHKGLSNDNILSMIEDKDNSDIIWIAPMAGGLNRFHKKTKAFTHYKHNPEDTESLGTDMLWDVYEDTAGNFWIATGGSGLNKFTKNQGTFKHYNQDNGFPADNVFSLLEDSKGNLWCSSDRGLIKFNPKNKKTQLYTKKDNICSFIFISRLRTAANQMWFGGSDGVISFYPEKMQDNPLVPPIVLTSLKQGGNDMDLNKSPETVKKITLGWRDNFFEFEYAALNYTKPEKNLYKYMLQGIDEDWFDAGTKRFGRYSGLSGGTYTLKIKGSNNDGIWNETGLSLKVTVKTAFWKSWWFYCVLALPIIFYVIKLQTEINERKRAEDALRESEIKFRGLVESTADWIWEVDSEGVYTYVSPQVETMLGYKPEEVVGKTPFDLMLQEEAGRIAVIFKNMVDTGKPIVALENIGVHKDGRHIFLETSGVPVLNESGKVTGYRGVDRDITERKRIEEELTRYRNHLENLVKKRTEALENAQKALISNEKLAVLGRLIATVSHELLNPLGVIRSSIYYLTSRLKSADPKNIKHTRRINLQIDQCHSIIKDLMEYSKGRKSVVFKRGINTFLKDTLNRIIEKEQTKFTLFTEFSPEVSLVLLDNEKMATALENLFKNATHAILAKNEYLSKKGNPYQPILKITTSMIDKNVKIDVEDNGIGMDAETLDQAFEPLFSTITEGSAGLGLSIVKKIILEHNGTVSIESKLNQGTTVSIVLPAVSKKQH